MSAVSGFADLSRTPGTPVGAASSKAELQVEVGVDPDAFFARWTRLAGTKPMPFHSGAWLRAWYGAFGAVAGRTPVLTAVRSRVTGEDLMLLPLVAQRRGLLSVLEFADASVVDYQFPLAASDWAQGEEPALAARKLWRALRQALRGHDVLRIEKMLLRPLDAPGGALGPLALALGTHACGMHGNLAELPEDFDAWRYSLDKRVRKELERCWRVFTRSANASFERVVDPAAALAVFEALEAQQSARMSESGRRYVLDDAPYRQFYRQVLAAGLADGGAVLTCLRDGDQVVAALFGIANGERFVALRLSTAGQDWAHCSPGRLLLERTARHLHAEGLRRFDFGIGEYAHKAIFKVQRIPLVDAVTALGWRGWPTVWAWRARLALKRRAWLMSVVRKFQRIER